MRNQLIVTSSALICACVRVCLYVCSWAVVGSEALPDAVVLACSITVGSDHQAHYLFIVSSRHGDCGNHTERRGAGAPCRHTLCRPYPWVPEERYMDTVTCGRTETTERCATATWTFMEKASLLQITVRSMKIKTTLAWGVWMHSFSAVLYLWHLHLFKTNLPCLRVVNPPSNPFNPSSSCYSETVPTQRQSIQLPLQQLDSKPSQPLAMSRVG